MTVDPPKMTIDVGQSLNLSCQINGHPVSSIVWIKNGRIVPQMNVKITGSASQLSIPSIGVEDKGVFQCFATNERSVAHGIAYIMLGGTLPFKYKSY